MRQPFHTDLRDDQWRDLRASVFDQPDAPPDLREVVNGLLYRDRSCCPWQLLPPGFPDRERLRKTWTVWQADGTWQRVRAIVSALPPPRRREPTSRLGRFRAAGARFLNALPGGELLLSPGRPIIRLAEWFAGCFTVHAKLPGWFREGHRRAVAGDYEGAVDYYSRVLAVDPTNLPTRQRRAYAFLQIGQLAEVCDDCRLILALPDLTYDAIAQVHFFLSEALVLSGDADRSIDHAFTARLITRQGENPSWGNLDAWESGSLSPGPDEFEMLANTHNDLAEYAINKKSDFATATLLYTRGEAYRKQYADWLEHMPDTTLFLSEDWVRNIGHMALIDFWLKMDRLGWRKWDRMLLIAPPNVVANSAYIDSYSRYFKVIRGDRVPAGIRHLTATFGPRVASLIAYPDGSKRYFTEGMGLIQEAWEKAGYGPLLEPSEADVAFGRKQLTAMGVPADAWFVALHARSPGYHKEGQGKHQSHRNATIASYLPAIREIVRRGGWVIRLGDLSMQPLPPTRGVIDYARGAFKSPRMDLFLCAKSRFFIGGASGISHVPTTFGTPCVLTNWLSNALPVSSKHDLFVPKMLRLVEEDRLLTFDEYLTHDTRLLCYSGTDLVKCGFEVVDNTADELRDVVVEMMDNLDGIASSNDGLVGAFDALARRHGLVGFSRIGSRFAARHSELLPSIRNAA